MGQQATINVFDGATTPVTHAFAGVGIKENGNAAMYQELSSTIPDGAQLRVKLSKVTLKSGTTVASIRCEVPIQEVVTGANASGYSAAPKVAFVDTGEYRQFAHPRSTPGGRRLCRQIVQNILSNTTTSVAPATAGPGPDLIDWLVMPT